MRLAAILVLMRIINRIGGMHGEHIASLVLARVPDHWLPTGGTYHVRRRGLHWQLDLADNLQRRMYLVGSYEALTLAALRRLMLPEDVVLDVGANIGTIALPLARRLRHPGQVIAVEAASDTTDRLRENITVNRLDDRVQVVQAALSDRDGITQLRTGSFGTGDVGTRTLEGDEREVGEPVRCITGDLLRQELGIERFDVVKIDVEGHERAVLNGLAQTFAQSPPRLVVLELVPANQTRAGGTMQSLIEQMSQLGYRGLAIRHRGLRPIPSGFSGNAIFTLGSTRSP